jgi:hypothetical protein
VPHWIDRPAGRLLELPLTTLRRFGQHLPAAGGAYFRVLPYGLVRSAFRAATREGRPGVFYLHPWELDPGQPVIRTSWVTRLRHRTGLGRTAARVDRLLSEFRFTSIGPALDALGARAAA